MGAQQQSIDFLYRDEEKMKIEKNFSSDFMSDFLRCSITSF